MTSILSGTQSMQYTYIQSNNTLFTFGTTSSKRNLLDPDLVVSHGVTSLNDKIYWQMWHLILNWEYIPLSLYYNSNFEKRYESAVKILGSSAVPHSEFDTKMITCLISRNYPVNSHISITTWCNFLHSIKKLIWKLNITKDAW